MTLKPLYSKKVSKKIRELNFLKMAECATIKDGCCMFHNSDECCNEETNTKHCLNFDFCYDYLVLVDKYRKKFIKEIKEEES